MITAPGNTRFIQSSVQALGTPYPASSQDIYPGGMGAPNNNDYYPVANGTANSTQSSIQLRWIRCADLLWQYEDLAFRPIMQKILAAWAQYNGLYDSDVDKDAWQSKKSTPYFFVMLERFAQSWVQFIEQKPGWFKGDATIPPMQLFTDLNTKHLSWWLHSPHTQFFNKFEEAVKSAWITGMAHMTITVEKGGVPLRNQPEFNNPGESQLFQDSIWKSLSSFIGQDQNGKGPDPDEFPFVTNPNMPRLCFEVIPTAHVRLDSSGRKRFKMWKTIMGVGEFLQTAEARGWDLQACHECIGGHSRQFDQEMNYRSMQMGTTRHQEAILHTVELLHFEGSLHDPQTGEPLFQKCYMVVANNRQVVYGPMPLCHWDGESVMVSAPLCQVSGGVYGRSPLTESIDMMDVKHDLNNVLLDYIRMTLQPPVQIDKSILADTAFEDSQFALYPHRVIRIRSNGAAGADAIRFVSHADLPVGFWQYMQWYQQQVQESTGMSSELMGAPQTRLRQTGDEQSRREAQAGKFQEGMWAGFERRFLSEVLRISNLRLLQFEPDNMWQAFIRGFKSSILPAPAAPGGQPTPVSPDSQVAPAWAAQIEKCAQWDAWTRYKYMGGFFTWRIDIFNNLSKRETEIEQITMFLNTAAKLGPQVFQIINLPFFVRKLASAFGYDESEALHLSALPMPNIGAFDNLDPASMMATLLGGEANTPDQQGGGALGQYAGMMAEPQPNQTPPGTGQIGPNLPSWPIGPPTSPPGGRPNV